MKLTDERIFELQCAYTNRGLNGFARAIEAEVLRINGFGCDHRGKTGSGSFMTREAAIEFWQRRRPGMIPTEKIISATIDAYSALFGDLSPVTPQPKQEAQSAEAVRVPDGYALAMAVLQSELYHQLDDDARAQCDAMLSAAPKPQGE